MKRTAAAFVGLLTVLAIGWWALAETPAEHFKRAEEAFEKHNYKEAALAYEAALKADPKFPKKARAGYHLIICWDKLREWKKAQAAAQRFVTAEKGTLWEARGLALLGAVTWAIPHWASKRGDDVMRGKYRRGYPWVSFQKEDYKKSIQAAEKARELFLGFLKNPAKLSAGDKKTLPEQTIANDFDLARYLIVANRNYGWWGRRRWEPLKTRAAKTDAALKKFYTPAKAYTADLTARRKTLFLLDEIQGLDSSKDKARAARALYRKALYLKPSWNTKTPAAYDPAVLLQRVVEKYKESPAAEDAQYALGLVRRDRQHFVEAVKAFRALPALFPKSRWLNDAAHQAEEITVPRLSLTRLGPLLPGQKVVLPLRTRNVPQVHFTAHRVKLEEAVRAMENRASRGYNDFVNALWRGEQLTRLQGEKVAEWDFTTADRKEHKNVSEQVPAALQKIGAYLIKATGQGVVARQMVVISDLAVTRIQAQGEQYFFVANAVSGKPVEGAELIVDESWWQHRQYQHHSVTVKSGELGLYRHVPSRRNSLYIQAFAHVNGRYAMTNNSWSYGRRGGGAALYRVYTTTDRPVYRPGQSVHFKLNTRKFERGEYALPGALSVRVIISDPKGNKLYERTRKLSAFGSLNDTLLLPGQTALGMYRLSVDSPELVRRKAGRLYGSINFRVEEYKKPEFEVTVAPEATQAKIGETVHAKIRARYFFGAPVTEAKVKYRVFREAYYSGYTPPGRYDWLYGRGYGKCLYPLSYWGGYWRGWGRYKRSRELIAEQQGPIGKDGTLDVTFETKTLAVRFPGQDHRFTIEAEVTDQSRRTIKGSGALTVTRSQFYVRLETKNNFYRPGDKVKLELRALTPDQAPVATQGTLTISRVKYSGVKNDKLTETVLAKRKIATDKEGRAFIEETLDEAGQFKFAFEARDAWKTKVQGSTFVWVRGEDFDARKYRFRDLEIITDKRSYREGEVAHLMINANYPDSYVLLSHDVGGQLGKFSVLHLPQKSKLLDIPIEKRHVPNFFLQAVMLRNGKLFQESRELFVPPEKNFLKLSVHADKKEYRPGQKGLFTFNVTDSEDKPVQAELAFTLFDSSILYFQKELAPEIKKFYFGQRRRRSVRVDSSHQLSYGARVVKNVPRHKFKRLYGNPPAYWGVWWRQEFREELAEKEKSVNRFAAAPAKAAARRSRGLARDGLELHNETQDKARGGLLAKRKKSFKGGGGSAYAKTEIRSNFADSAAWAPTILTGPDGQATLEVTFPDSLTTWKGSVYGLTKQTQAGSASTSAVSTKKLLVRLQAPRFFVERDEVVLSANVHNYLKSAKKVHCELQVPSQILACHDPLSVDVDVPAGGEKRLDWTVKVLREGHPTITVKALTGEESDAMALSFPALVHGAEKFVAESGSYRPDQMGAREITFNIPKERKPEATELRVTFSPSLAGAMLDALPYLIDYPYGCCEQTMSRFLPAVVAQSTLKGMGINLEDLANKRKQLTPKQLERIGYLKSPVFDSSQLAAIVQDGLRRLYSFQNGDGGWGWWKNGQSNTNMSAYVLYGLNVAKKAGVPGVNEARRKRGLQFLKRQVARIYKEKRVEKAPWRRGYGLEQEAYGSYVLALDKQKDAKALGVLWTKRDDLNAYGKALLALTLSELGDARARTAYENLMQFVKEDPKNGTAWVRTPQKRRWYWYNNSIESNAWTLKALAKIAPKSVLGPKLVKHLLNQRKGYRWHSTKDTAMTLYALADYMTASGETDPEYTITVDFDGIAEKKITVTKANFFTFDNRFVIKGSDIPSGARKVTIKKDGPGALYYSAQLKFFTKEGEIKGAGSEISVTRKYYKLTSRHETKKVKNAKGEDVEITVLKWDRAELPMGAQLKSSEQLEVELTINAPNDYEYLVIEDFKPAGCEPVALVSGTRYGDGLCSNMELRDTKVAFFITWLSKGTHVLKYKLRAETPGVFHALPAKVQAMYSPDVRAISDEMRLGIKD